MPQFQVSGTNAEGKRVKVNVEARDETHARERATRHGINVISLAAADPAPLATRQEPTPAARDPQPAIAMPMPPQQHLHVHSAPATKGTSGLGIAALVLGIIACLISWIPFAGMLSIPIAGIGILLAGIGFIISLSGGKSGVGMPVAGGVACAVAVVVALISTIGTTAAVGSAANEMAKAVEKAQKEREAQRAAQTATAVTPADPTPQQTPPAQTPARPQAVPAINQQQQQPTPARPQQQPGRVAQQTPAATPKEEKPPVDASKTPIAQPDGSIKIGDLIVACRSPRIGQVALKNLGEDSQSKDALLILTVSITNKSDVKRLPYETWQGADFAFGRDFATLVDEHGNSYKRISFGFATEITGQVKSGTVEPGDSLTDVLVFEKPIAKATTLTLELPGKNIGKDGATLRFQIPAPKPGK